MSRSSSSPGLSVVNIAELFCERCLFQHSCSCLRDDPVKSKELKKFINALRDVGFLQVVGHMVEPSLIDEVFLKSQEFFHRSDEFKRSKCSKDRARRGYSPSSSENFATLIGESGKPNDTVEKFRIGPFVDADALAANRSYFESKEGRIHFYPNDFESMPEHFDELVRNYYHQMTALSSRVLALIAHALNLPPASFEDSFTHHTSILSCNYYARAETKRNHHRCKGDDYEKVSADLVPESPKSLTRIAQHTDVSVLTIVAQKVLFEASKETGDDGEIHQQMGGLQIFDASRDSWVPVPYIADSLVINIGDCLHDWSGGVLTSALHRVVMYEPHGSFRSDSYNEGNNIPAISNSINDDDANADQSCPEGLIGFKTSSDFTRSIPTCSRYSLAFFFAPNYDAHLRWPTDSQFDTKVESYTEWRKARIAKAMKKLKKS